MPNEFQERLRKLLSDKGVTASELSRISGIGKSDISNYLNGKYLPKQDKIYLIAQALGVDPGWLITGVEQNKGEKVFPKTKEAQFVSIAMDMMPAKERERAVNVLKAMYSDYFNQVEDKIG